MGDGIAVVLRCMTKEMQSAWVISALANNGIHMVVSASISSRFQYW